MARLRSIGLSIFFLIAMVAAAGGASEDPKSPAAAPAPDGYWRLEMTGETFTLEARDAQRLDILNEIARLSGATLGSGAVLTGRVTLSVAHVFLEEMLARLLRNTALVFAREPVTGRYRIIDIQGFTAAKAGDGRGDIPAPDGDPPRSGAGVRPGAPGGDPPVRPAAPAGARPRGPVDAQGRFLYKPGELLVRFKPEATEAQRRLLHESLGGHELAFRPRLRLARVKVAEAVPELAAVRDYLASGLVAHAERHVLRYPLAEPDDPLYGAQWAHGKMASAKAWNATTGNPSVVIAVIDSGIDYNHPDLAANLHTTIGWDFADDDPDPFDADASGHGTHVAGITAAVGNNGIGISGVTWQARVMALKIQADGGSAFEGLAAIDAMDYARDNGARIVNCSYGGAGFSSAEEAAIAALGAEGVLVVCASGNSSSGGLDADLNPIYPAAYGLTNIVSVGASTSADLLASYSYYGAASVDLLAPGSTIRSTIPAGAHTSASVKTVFPAAAAYPAIGLLYAGLTGAAGVTGPLTDCGEGYPDQFPGDMTGKLALIRRSDPDTAFTFAQKVGNAAAAGAAGVVIYNNRSIVEDPQDTLDTEGGTLGNPGEWLPAVTITMADGAALLAAMPVGITLVHAPAADSVNYGDKSGTSMAAPQVTGAAALLWSLKPQLSVGQVKAALMNGVDPIPAAAGKTVSGGRLNVAGAMDTLCRTSPLTGDIDCSWDVDLADAIIVLQVLAGQGPDFCEPCFAAGTDPDADGRVSMADAVNLLQRAAALRGP